MKRLIATIICAVGLAGCSALADNMAKQDPGPFPENYKELMAAHVKTTFFDPYSMRDVKLSQPVQGQMMFRPGWLVCLQANAKNRMGGYIGLTNTAYLIRDGEIQNSVEGSPVCDHQNYAPWPEMEMRASNKS